MALWREFEEDIGQLVEFFGYGGEVTRPAGDNGVDVLARRGSRVVAIQCKLHDKNSVGSKPIQMLLASKVIHGATHFICFTTGTFTRAAKELAASTNTILIDRQGLLTVCRDNKLTLRPCCVLRGMTTSFHLADQDEIGRHTSCTHVLGDPRVSGRHAKLHREGLRLYVTDLQSTNGTFVNQYPLTPNKKHLVTYGDRIKFGTVECNLSMFGE